MQKEGKDSGRPSDDVEEDGDVIVSLSESVTLTKGMARPHHQIDGQMTRAPCLECVYRLAQTGTVLECPNDLDTAEVQYTCVPCAEAGKVCQAVSIFVNPQRKNESC